MKFYKSAIVGSMLGSVVGNYSFQFFTEQNYEVAFERTYFMIFGLLIFWCCNWIANVLEGK